MPTKVCFRLSLGLMGGLLLVALGVVTLGADSANFDQLKSYYQTRESVASRFFSKPGKTFHIYVVNRELLQDEDTYDKQATHGNLAQGMYRQFVARLESKGSPVKLAFMGDREINWDAADVIIIIKSTWVSTQVTYLQAQSRMAINEVELNYKVYIPSVYGSDAVADYVMRETLPDSSLTQRSVESLFAEKLKRIYAWQDNDRLLNYLNGSVAEKPFIQGRLTMRPDDEVAAKLLALSDWTHEQTMLTMQGEVQGLVAAKNLYPFSPALSKLVYNYALDIVDIRLRVDLLCYLYLAGNKDLQYLLNDILSQATDANAIEDAEAVVRISAILGDKETLEHLSRIADILEDEKPTSAGRFQIKKAIAAIEKRY